MQGTEAVMSFLSALFGRRPDDASSGASAAKLADPVEYKDQTAGTIAREIGGVRKEHRFIRADACASYEEAVNFTLSKARQIIDLQGAKIFD
jgi:hypothetical protein